MPSTMLPRDDSASGFDNVAEVLKVTPSFLEQYLTAARQVSIEALGNAGARTTSTVYSGNAAALQYMQMPGLPLGTRGGLLLEHRFPADGEYEITISGLVGGGYVWGVMDPLHADRHRGRRSRVLRADRRRGRPGGHRRAAGRRRAAINERFRNIRVKVPAGLHRIGVTYKQKTAAEHNEVLHGFVPVAGMAQMVNGNSGGPRISNVEIKGPFKARRRQ